ncbi:MAG: hypothetical protein LBF90_00695 [Prevotellaceae bacterium]|jgi:hypothetical protein|nr:hypothetical protein [Prevotellaceae bacterium]
MKKYFLFSFVLTASCLLSQPLIAHSEPEKTLSDVPTFPKNEIKINLAFLYAPALQVYYEYLINDESGIGFSVMKSFNNETFFYDHQVLGFYRFYFGKKPADGFFAELNVAAYTYDENYWTNIFRSNPLERKDIFTGGAGISFGWKFVTKNNIVFELLTGGGRSFFHPSFYLQGAVTIGKRF